MTFLVKLGRVVNQGGVTPPSKWSFENHVITWQIKNLISTSLQHLWPTNLPGWWLGWERHLPSHTTFWQHGHLTNEKLSTHFSSKPIANKHDRMVTLGGSIGPNKSRDLLITLSHDKWKTLYTHNSTTPVATELGRILI